MHAQTNHKANDYQLYITSSYRSVRRNDDELGLALAQSLHGRLVTKAAMDVTTRRKAAAIRFT
jgi:hypothetical protein